MKRTIIFVMLAACAWCQALPPAASPGVANPLVTQENLATTVCVANWTKTVRPPVSFTNRLKAEQMQAEGLTGLAIFLRAAIPGASGPPAGKP